MAKKPATSGRRSAQIEAIGLDAICARISGGESQAKIASEIGVSPSTFCEWIAASPERSARVREARSQSADAYADMAEEVLRLAESSAIEISRARELASHYRWMASKRRPAEYGERQQVEQKIDLAVSMSPDERDARIAELLARDGVIALPKK